ncbi:MAG: discoidin domain-containing protein [Nocardioides sp.]
MSEPRLPGDLPPDVSPEYAEAYRRAYLRALSQSPSDDPEDVEATQQIGSLDSLLTAAPETPATPAETHQPYDAPAHDHPGPPHVATNHDHPERYDAFTYDEPAPRDRPGWLVPALLAGMVVLLLAAAYGAGTVFSSSVGDNTAADDEPDGIVMGEDGSTSGSPEDDNSPQQAKSPEGQPYQGVTDAAAIGSADASCQAPSSVDAAGNPVRYPASNAFDGDLTTAWRCGGDGVGERLQINLSDTVRIGELGIVPGYAKTDPRNGTDRYAENNRLTKVRWTFPDGTSVVQKLDGSADNRDMQTQAIPLVEANVVTLEVLSSTKGKRNTIAVSEIRIGAATG